ncbi:MAG TPA: hypothetical protein VNZ57_15270 [Longimicrobiales bacterium]|nr:hypothetical protein [Longimicrobiales bacterium]
MSDSLLPVRIVVADNGSFRDLTLRLPPAAIERHERLIDAIREDPEINASIFIDSRRLVAAWILSEAELESGSNGAGGS